jgi:Zn-finger domain-containing protein
MCEITLFYIPDRVSEGDYRYLMSKVSVNRRKRIYKICSEMDVYRSLLGESLVRALACEKLNLPNDKIHFIENLLENHL